MSRRRRFSASNDSKSLEEAVNSIEEDSEDVLEYDLAMIPPEPSVVTDDEEGFDDDNVLRNLQNDVPGNIEVFVRDKGVLSDSSDDEPLATKRARIRSTVPQAADDFRPAQVHQHRTLLSGNYNKGMGGVDEMDQSISLYRIGIHGKKWWWVLYTYMIDMAIANAWRLHIQCRKEPMDQLLFRRSIARFYLKQSPQRHSARPSSSNIEGLQLDGVRTAGVPCFAINGAARSKRSRRAGF
ncbi:unnamed protein product [Arctia plantaginis]|uniref:PiggyBac transposable element-derived protein domain-containing protein n=1 Tax=Arctia plantaginis TaxID=874455 RepID=A0A8S1AA15_ARCPL|nr:unnamed protein product [Arctia plantaginis]